MQFLFISWKLNQLLFEFVLITEVTKLCHSQQLLLTDRKPRGECCNYFLDTSLKTIQMSGLRWGYADLPTFTHSQRRKILSLVLFSAEFTTIPIPILRYEIV